MVMNNDLTQAKEELKEIEYNRRKSEVTTGYRETWMAELFEEVLQLFQEFEFETDKWYQDFEFDMDMFGMMDNGLALREKFAQHPRKAIRAIEDALMFVGNPEDRDPKKQVWLRILTTKRSIDVKDLDTKSLHKLVVLEGIVKSKSADLIGRRMWSRWHCYNCKGTVTHGIYDKQTKSYCPDCKKNRNLVNQRDCSVFYIKLDDVSEKPNTSSRSVAIQVLFGQGEAETFNRVRIGSRVKVTGILKRKRSSAKKQEYKYYLECRNLEFLEDTYKEINITSQDIERFKQVSKTDSLYDDLAQSIAPNIKGYKNVKTACLLQLVGGSELQLDGQREERGPIHILLVSSPGLGKTKLMKRVMSFLPGARFTGGKTASGVGLVAAMNKDEDIGGWYVSAGAVPMAHNSLCCIDEGDKISKEDLAYLNNAMVDMSVNIDKAGLHATLQTNTAILLSCNPKNRVFEPHQPVWKQIGLPKDFLDRFDLVIPMLPPTSMDQKKRIARLIVGKYQRDQNFVQPVYDHEFMTKYIDYAKKLEPMVTPEVTDYIVDNYVDIAKPADRQDAEDNAYFSFRLLTNIVILSQAVAKLRLEEDEIKVEDAQRAINLLIDSLKKQQIITTDGLMDYERAEAIVPKSKRDKIRVIKNIISDLQEGSKDHVAEIGDIIKFAEKEGIDEQLAMELIEKLNMVGDIMQSRRGRYRLI